MFPTCSLNGPLRLNILLYKMRRIGSEMKACWLLHWTDWLLNFIIKKNSMKKYKKEYIGNLPPEVSIHLLHLDLVCCSSYSWSVSARRPVKSYHQEEYWKVWICQLPKVWKQLQLPTVSMGRIGKWKCGRFEIQQISCVNSTTENLLCEMAADKTFVKILWPSIA